jgi:hypothetical protein
MRIGNDDLKLILQRRQGQKNQAPDPLEVMWLVALCPVKNSKNIKLSRWPGARPP